MREETLCKQSCGSLKGEALQVEFAESASEGAGTCGGGGRRLLTELGATFDGPIGDDPSGWRG